MKPIPPEIKILYDAALVKKGVLMLTHFPIPIPKLG